MAEQLKNKLCCIFFTTLLKKDDFRLYFNSRSRRCTIKIPSSGSYQILQYCFFCGTKLPDDLTDIWEETIKKELKIDDPWDALYEETLPEEFMTDQWWKKRGL